MASSAVIWTLSATLSIQHWRKAKVSHGSLIKKRVLAVKEVHGFEFSQVSQSDSIVQ